MSTFTIEFKKHFAIVSWSGASKELQGVPAGKVHVYTEDPLSSTKEARDKVELNLYRLRQILNNLAGDRDYCTLVDNREPGK